MNISNYDISSTVATTISQRLVRKLCPHCKKERPFTDDEKELIKSIGDKYGVTYDLDHAVTYDPVGCEKCEGTGFYDRIAMFEVLIFSEDIKELVVKDASTLDIRKKALEEGYKPLITQGLKYVTDGITTLDELNDKLMFF